MEFDKNTLIACLLGAVLAFLIAFFIGPPSMKKAEAMEDEARNCICKIAKSLNRIERKLDRY
jgi:hypothetical protein